MDLLVDKWITRIRSEAGMRDLDAGWLRSPAMLRSGAGVWADRAAHRLEIDPPGARGKHHRRRLRTVT